MQSLLRNRSNQVADDERGQCQLVILLKTENFHDTSTGRRSLKLIQGKGNFARAVECVPRIGLQLCRMNHAIRVPRQKQLFQKQSLGTVGI